MKKECNVVMLATEKVSNIVQLLSDTISYTTTENIPGGKYQYLYITSDEEIKEGDWIINNVNNVTRFAPSTRAKWNCKKIIATTDISLIKECIHLPCKKHPEGLFKSLPQIPQSFIDTFIEEYNKGNVIDKVMVEDEKINWSCDTEKEFALNFDRNDPKNKGKKFIEFDYEYQLIINPDNTINISLIEEEKKYTKSDLKNAFNAGYERGVDISSGEYDLLSPSYEDWIKENLK